MAEHTFPAYAPRVGSELRASLLQIPLFGDEHLLVQVINIHPTLATEVVLAGRLWSEANRTVQYFDERIPAPADAANALRQIVLERGALLSLAARVGGLSAGNVWIRAILSKGLTLSGSTTFPMTVLQGYIGEFQDVAWPGSPVHLTTDGPGVIRVITWTQASALVLTATVPPSRRWRLVTGQCSLTTDATAGLRLVTFGASVDAQGAFFSESTPQQGPGLIINYCLTPGISPSAVAPFRAQGVPFVPDLEVRAGGVLALRSDLGPVAGAADALAGVGLIVREWFEP